VQQPYLTNDTRTATGPQHIIFAHRASDGQTRMYIDGVLNSFCTSTKVCGTATASILYVYQMCTTYPSPDTWMDNLTVCDTLTAF
jgi:hypothetical protein